MSVARQTPVATLKIRRFFKISLMVGLLVLLNYGGRLAVEQINFQLWPEHENLMVTMLWFAVVVYVIWMAMPFVPGIELGLALMVMLGAKGVVLVYLCTLLSLSLSFAVGRLIPLKAFSRFLGWLHRFDCRNEQPVPLPQIPSVCQPRDNAPSGSVSCWKIACLISPTVVSKGFPVLDDNITMDQLNTFRPKARFCGLHKLFSSK